MNIGSHAKAVSCMEWSHDLGSLVTGGWDGRVHIWCVRMTTAAVWIGGGPRGKKRYKVPYLLPVLTYASHEKNRDPRKQGEAKSLPPSEKVYTLAVQGPRIVVGAADRSVLIYDSRFVKLRIVKGRSRSARSLGIHRSIPLRAQYPPTGT